MAAELVHPTPQQKWLLVTSAFHMPRAMACFRKAGWDVYPATTGYMTGGDLSTRLNFSIVDHLQAVTIALREYYGLIAYRLMDIRIHYGPSLKSSACLGALFMALWVLPVFAQDQSFSGWMHTLKQEAIAAAFQARQCMLRWTT